MTKQEFDVLTIGNAIVDVIAKVDEAFVAREKLVKGSMNLIDEARAEGPFGITIRLHLSEVETKQIVK